jgi:very-short-patch-repair endonuclease
MSKKYTLEEVIYKANLIHEFKYDYSLINTYNNMHDVVNIICPKHGEFKQSFHHHINKKRGCKYCAINNVTSNTEEFIKKSKKIHGDKYIYDKVNYINCKEYIIITCPKHGDFLQRARDHIYKKEGCPKCNNFNNEQIIINILTNKNVNFEYQKMFDLCKNKRKLKFDFYLPDYNLCIEYDGEQHYKIVEYWGGEKGLKYRKNNDIIKDNYCKENNINLLRISYKDFNNIETILKNILDV